MAVMTFSQRFPNKHPRKIQLTYFVEKMLTSLGIDYRVNDYHRLLMDLNKEKIEAGKLKPFHIDKFYFNLNRATKHWNEKGHTIRKGNRWSVGDKFYPVIWTGRPYHDPQLIFAPEIKVVKTWQLIRTQKQNPHYSRNSKATYDAWTMPKAGYATTVLQQVANNDGLSLPDLKAWFPLEFDGQIICWDKEIVY